ncbi:recombination-associated protein RdgC [Rhodoferax sp.]|uniref:recombination-associated protein RdgC n=1 Tax=Rhodoferax sp. TaxID=50421 RepID=UPI00273073F1|nr:recombination-associated protein RdgC [Rhodoferax sp.]MDP1530658.1 recombination-associated protein RdgC [Rhodoferax sp.]MDP1944721.1 recombination-associated protein RdgC [Rhodoferax sp.]MDP2443582.1 recombination-associated protein RdgC [Rhodoferax sp.]MDZ4208320.1 recombination-associated protein RdgC [Rhodoferax sp.]
MFKNVIMYRIAPGWSLTAEQVEARLQDNPFVECGASQEKSVGWVAPRGEANGPLLEAVAGQWILKLMLEVRALPASVVNRKAQERVAQIEASTGRKPGKKETRDLKDDIRLELLPMAFTKQSSTRVWLDREAQLLVTDAGSQARADELITFLVQALPGLALSLIDTQISPSAAMADWLVSQEAPQGFSVDRECELKAADESKAVVRYARHRLDTEEVKQHIEGGKMPTRLALTWNDRVSFVLTEGLQLKKLAFLDVVFEGTSQGKDDGFDADVAIATGELQKALPALLEALGGERVLPG